MKGDAVSAAIGAILLIAVAVAAMAIVTLVLLSGPLPTNIPSVSGLISVGNNSHTIYISHQGGDPLGRGQYKILVDNDDKTASFGLNGQEPWSTGKTLNYTFSGALPSRVVVLFNSSWGGATVLLSADLGTPVPLGSCYSRQWPYRKSITIDHSKVSGTLTSFPVLISLASDSDLRNGALATGNDILFTASDGTTKLDHEIETYTSSTGRLVAWVKVPSLSNMTDTVLFMYYNNSGAGDQSNKNGVWSNGYNGVWHLNNSFTDSTSNNNHGTNYGSTDTTGQIGAGRFFDGNKNTIDFGTSGTLQPSELTASFWIKRTISWSGLKKVLFWAKPTSYTGNGWYMDMVDDLNDNRPLNLVVDSTGYINTAGIDPNDFYPQNEWTYVVFTFSSSSNVPRAYKNGVNQTLTTANNPESITSTANRKYLAAQPAATTNISAGFDEVRVSGTVRSPDWVTTEYTNQKDPSSFYRLGTEDGSCTAPSFPTFVQAGTGQIVNTKNGDVTFSRPTTKGNLLVISINWSERSKAIESVRYNYNPPDFPLAVGPTNWGASAVGSTYYMYDNPGGATTIQVAFPAGTKLYANMYAAEYSGVVNTTDPLDRISIQSGTGQALNSGSNTTTQAKELIYGFCGSDATATPYYPYTARASGYGNFIADQSVGSLGTYYVAGTNNQNGAWMCQMATFKGK